MDLYSRWKKAYNSKKQKKNNDADKIQLEEWPLYAQENQPTLTGSISRSTIAK